eukprot:scaffold45757_cov56-Attheya_sp.AAC.3
MATLSIGRAASRRLATVGSAKRGFSSLLTMTDEFPGLPLTTPTPSKASSPSVTTLASGLTIVSEDSSSTSTVSLTFPRGGSADELLSEGGAALVNKNLAFKSGSGLSSALILRNLEDDGATPFSTAGRRGATVGFTAAPDKAVRLVPLLATSCSFEKWDMRDALKLSATEASVASENAQIALTEQLFAAAYGAQSTMGRPFYMAGASAEGVKSFRASQYNLDGAVLSATGISDHAAFVTAVEEGFSDLPGGSGKQSAAAAYIGGEARVHAPSTEYAHVALAFEGPQNSALLHVMMTYLTMNSADNLTGFAAPGLVGIYGGAPSAAASNIVDSLCTTLTGAPLPGNIEHAKAIAKADAVFALDAGSRSLAEAMTGSVLEKGSFSASGLAASYDSITTDDVTSAFAALVKSSPSMAAVGDISSVPYHATVAARFS